MTNPTSVMALFCDDIREDKSGTLSLMGIFADNASVPALPDVATGTVGLIPRLCVYIRVNFDVSVELGDVSMKLIGPDGAQIFAQTIDDATIAQARATRERGNPIAALISHIQLINAPLPKLGRFIAEVTVGRQTYLAGALNYLIAEDIAKVWPSDPIKK
jgi:hypothetical protein